MKVFSRTTFGVALGAAMATQSASAQVPEDFDAFDIPQAEVADTVVGGGGAQNSINDAPSAGITRTISVNLTAGTGARADVSTGQYHFSLDAGVPQSRGTSAVRWTIPGASCLDWGDVTGIRLAIQTDHPVPATLQVNGASYPTSIPDTNSQPITHDIAISGDGCVTSVALTFDATGDNSVALDMDLDTVALLRTPIVPVPAVSAVGLGLAVLGIPLAAAGLARRRRSKLEKG